MAMFRFYGIYQMTRQPFDHDRAGAISATVGRFFWRGGYPIFWEVGRASGFPRGTGISILSRSGEG